MEEIKLLILVDEKNRSVTIWGEMAEWPLMAERRPMMGMKKVMYA